LSAQNFFFFFFSSAGSVGSVSEWSRVREMTTRREEKRNNLIGQKTWRVVVAAVSSDLSNSGLCSCTWWRRGRRRGIQMWGCASGTARRSLKPASPALASKKHEAGAASRRKRRENQALWRLGGSHNNFFSVIDWSFWKTRKKCACFCFSALLAALCGSMAQKWPKRLTTWKEDIFVKFVNRFVSLHRGRFLDFLLLCCCLLFFFFQVTTCAEAQRRSRVPRLKQIAIDSAARQLKALNLRVSRTHGQHDHKNENFFFLLLKQAGCSFVHNLFFTAFGANAIFPTRGSIFGGTQVHVCGFGFRAHDEGRFGQIEENRLYCLFRLNQTRLAEVIQHSAHTHIDDKQTNDFNVGSLFLFFLLLLHRWASFMESRTRQLTSSTQMKTSMLRPESTSGRVFEGWALVGFLRSKTSWLPQKNFTPNFWRFVPYLEIRGHPIPAHNFELFFKFSIGISDKRHTHFGWRNRLSKPRHFRHPRGLPSRRWGHRQHQWKRTVRPMDWGLLTNVHLLRFVAISIFFRLRNLVQWNFSKLIFGPTDQRPTRDGMSTVHTFKSKLGRKRAESYNPGEEEDLAVIRSVFFFSFLLLLIFFIDVSQQKILQASDPRHLPWSLHWFEPRNRWCARTDLKFFFLFKERAKKPTKIPSCFLFFMFPLSPVLYCIE